jgi:enoyl-CoA hydratase/carnithine racemase
MLDQARQLGEAAGQAGLVNRAITLASATYDFDAIDMELRCLKQIPLRGLDATRAASLASAAEAIATRAEADRRPDKAVAATLLAYRAWQRAGNKDAARQAASRHDALVQGTTKPHGGGTPVP